MNVSKDMENMIKERLGYNDEEVKVFLDNPRNSEVLSKSLKLLGKTIIAEVVESHGCNSQHKVGDKIYFDGAGNLLTKLSPNRICIYALAELDKLIYTTNELLLAGIDPNEMRFNRISCTDVGLKCDGWGQIVLELKIIDRNKL